VSSIGQWLAEEGAKEARRRARKRARFAAGWRRMNARRGSTCPDCKAPIAIGDPIAMPFEPNRAGGNLWRGCWYCAPCAKAIESQIAARWGLDERQDK